MKIKLLLLFLLLNSTIFAQTIFKGRVTDNTKEPLAGVTVMVKNTTIGTFTGADGTFELRYSADAPFTLVLSSLGYNTREMELSPQSAASLGDIVLMEGN
ncbi:MAG: carboxypeptidase-like regulatory domain-containing protein, partial [Bacteroidales bacterium]